VSVYQSDVAIVYCVVVVARRQMKSFTSSSSGNGNNIAQSHVIEHQLRDNPIYARSTAPHLDNCNSMHHQHQQQQQHPHHHSYEKLDHVIINPTSSSTNPAYNLLTTPAVTSPDVVNTMGYLVASPTSRDQLARPIIIWAPRSRDANNMAELNVVTDQHGRQCCCTSASGLPSTATSGGGDMECETRTRNHVVGGEESRERHHVTGGAESGCLSRDQNTNHRCRSAGQYTSMTQTHNRLNDWNISAL